MVFWPYYPWYINLPQSKTAMEYWHLLNNEPEALKSLYRSPGYKKNQLVLSKNYVLQW
jgi:hypothetical protein